MLGLGGLGHRLDVEQDGRDVDAGDAVDERVVGLGDSAKRFRVSPWTSHSSQSGFVRSSCWEKTRAAILRSCSSEPGAGSAEWRTWYSRLKLGSSTQNGRPVCAGGKASFWRKRGTRCRRERDVVEQVVVARRRALEDQIAPTCMWLAERLVGEERGVERVSRSMCP